MTEVELISQAKVTIKGKKTGTTKTMNTGVDGTCSFTKLDTDEYALTIEKTGYETYTHPETLKIIAGKNNNFNLEIQLAPLTRTIIINYNKTTKNSTITLTDTNDSTNKFTSTNKTGTVTFQKVPFGQYTLTIINDDYENYTQNITINKSNNNPRTIECTLTEKEE